VESRGYYYSAASYYFQALVYALWRYYLLSSLRREGSLDSVRANVSSRVLSVLSAIRGMAGGRSSLSIWELDAAIAAADRAYEALLYLNTSQSQSSVDSATYYLALASSRARTAELWLSLVGAAAPPGPSGSIGTEALSETSTSLEYLLDNILAYILSFQGSVSIPSDTFNEMVSRLELAKTAGDPVEKLALEVSALAYGYVTLVRMFTQDPNATTEVLSRSIGVLASGDLLNRTPTSLVLYLEFAEVQEDPVQRVYTLARVAALASFYVDALRPRVAAEYASTTQQTEVGTAVPRTITVVVTATEGAGRSTATYFLSGVAVGVLVSVALFLVATLASRRSRRL
jgi:predicted S18 family serine protease